MAKRCFIYLDESGDLGFSFAKPYRAGGSSRHLTLAAAICPSDSNKYLKRFITRFYRDRGIPHGTELKWVDLDAASRLDFAERAQRLVRTHREIRLCAMTVYKQKVMAHIQADPNKLYNYMVGLMLLPVMKEFEEVLFVPDARSIKVASGNSLHDYLQTQLWFELGATTKLQTAPSDSAKSRTLHFTDYVCGTFQSFYEDGHKEARGALEPVTACRKLYFP